MTNRIELTIISDVVCPWCLIGYKRLEKAIFEMGIQDKVEIEWEPFELNPQIPAEGQDLQEHIITKYGMGPDDCTRALASMATLGAELGFKFDFFDTMKMINTRDAHILLAYAKRSGKQTALKLRLFEAFFSDRKDISDQQVLTQALHDVGLNADEGLTRIMNTDVRKKLQARQAHWRNLGVMSVPTMIFNHSRVVNGAQSIGAYRQILTEFIEQ
jgi:predicted DsbA family dithiol-disulfide isomerase